MITITEAARIALHHGGHANTCYSLSIDAQCKWDTGPQRDERCDCGWTAEKKKLLEVLYAWDDKKAGEGVRQDAQGVQSGDSSL